MSTSVSRKIQNGAPHCAQRGREAAWLGRWRSRFGIKLRSRQGNQGREKGAMDGRRGTEQEDGEEEAHFRQRRGRSDLGLGDVASEARIIPRGEQQEEDSSPPRQQPAEQLRSPPSSAAAASVVGIRGVPVDLWCAEEFLEIEEPHQENVPNDGEGDGSPGVRSDPSSSGSTTNVHGLQIDLPGSQDHSRPQAPEEVVDLAGPSSRRPYRIVRPYSQDSHLPLLRLSPFFVRVGSILVDLYCHERMPDIDPRNQAPAPPGVLSPCPAAPADSGFARRGADRSGGLQLQQQQPEEGNRAATMNVPNLPPSVIRIGSFLIDLRCYEKIDEADPCPPLDATTAKEEEELAGDVPQEPWPAAAGNEETGGAAGGDDWIRRLLEQTPLGAALQDEWLDDILQDIDEESQDDSTNDDGAD